MKKLLLLWLMTLMLSSAMLQAQTCRSAITANTPDSRFVVNEQEVVDSQTGLVWQKCTLGQSGTDCLSDTITYTSSYTWKEALQEAQTQRETTGKMWRLPNIKELLSIVERQCFEPAINLSIFPNTMEWYPSHYWSATFYADSQYRGAGMSFITQGDNYTAWGVEFYNGRSSRNGKNDLGYVRLVRTGE